MVFFLLNLLQKAETSDYYPVTVYWRSFYLSQETACFFNSSRIK